VPLDYVHVNHLSVEKLRQYKLVVFSYPLMIPEASVSVLTDYVRGGGALVAEARLAWNNEKGFASDRIPGLGLWEVMGCREAAIETPPGGKTAVRWTSADLPGVNAGDTLPARWYKETLEPLSPSARVVAQFADGAPAAVMSTFGKGKTLMLGSYVSAAAQSSPTPEAERFFAGLLEWAGVRLPIRVAGAPIEARHLESGSSTLLFLFNHAKQEARSEVTMRLAAGDYAAIDLVTGQTVELRPVADGVSVSVILPPSGVQVVKIAAK
jgi:beta-galactosidase